jgi:hypothetical protein
MASVSNFWDSMVLIASSFVFVACLVIVFQIVVDPFGDSELGGGAKALWIIGPLDAGTISANEFACLKAKALA